MAEIKNSFLRSKMNKDLDDRLIPNGEYRDAQNISVGKSEADDIGALETVLGNSLATNFGLSVANLKVIGYHSIENSNKIIVFLTDNSSAVPGTSHYIYEFLPSNPPNLLVTGVFLNFSQDFPISGISVIEDLLFWTDNNNQPRKINIGLAANGAYYREENHISVAKYNPYQPIGLLNKVSKITTGLAGAVLSIADTTGIKKGMAVVEYGNSGANGLQPENYVYVESIITNTSVTLNDSTVTGVANGDTIYFLETTMTGKDITYNFNNEDYADNTWPGDPDYLESRFVRLSYRFEFDDGEYSIMAPFTPIAFIPKQKGYFLGNSDGSVPDDEDSTYRSTIVEFMENGVQNIELLIPFPDTLNNVQPSSSASYKIKSLDILYKESDATAVKVVDTINYSDEDDAGNTWTATTNSNIYIYNYQSRKPFRTLPTNQTVRVYDKVPVKALAQETAGNRIIYGNFLDKYSAPNFLRYVVNVTPKSTSLDYDSWAEFPNQSLKQNRNYQVGFVLADKFGRQSDVILSEVKPLTTIQDNISYGGDTVYAPYNTSANQGTIRDWFGDSLKVNITRSIESEISSSDGTPGLYAIPISTGTGYNTFQSSLGDQPSITGNTYTFKLGADYTQIPTEGSYLAGEFTDYVEVESVGVPVALDARTRFNQSGGTNINLNINALPSNYQQITTGWVVTGLTSSSVVPCLVQSVTGIVGSDYVIVTNSSIFYTANVILTFTPPAGSPVTVTTNGQVSSAYLQQSPSDPDVKFAYNINPTGWYSYKIVVKQQEQDYYNVYLPGILSGYPEVSTSHQVPFPNDPPNATANIVLINDNINKIPRDLSEVGPDQKQFRSSVQLFGRVNNDSPTSNVQYFPNISTDTAVSISASNDSNMEVGNLSTIGKGNLYQLDSKPLIARLSTNASNPIGITTTTMLPYLAIYETEPQESLLDIFWETSTSGLISVLNDVVSTSFQGAVGWEPYNSSNFSESSTGNFLSSLLPIDQSGTTLPDTDISRDSNGNPVISSVTNGYGNDVSGQFSVTRTGGPAGGGAGTINDPYVYNFQKVGTEFVYEADPKLRTYTITTNITNLTIPSSLQINVTLQNIPPTITTSPSPIDKNVGNSGYVVTIEGVNGAAQTNLNQNQLQWSMTGGGGYFTINSGNGEITQASGTAAGTYNLIVTLTDANGTGASSATVTQQVVVATLDVGFQFLAGAKQGKVPDGVCPSGGGVDPTCGGTYYYNVGQSGSFGTATPVDGDIISTDAQQIIPAGRGFYSFDCNSGGGTSRKYFYIESNTTGAVYAVTNCP